MANGSACQDEYFNNGVTNGADWYELEGQYVYTTLILVHSNIYF